MADDWREADSEFRPAVFIPAYQCATTIAAVVGDVCRQVRNVLVVDDGSTDDTAARAGDAGAEVIRHDGNRGKGAALVTGMRYLYARGATHALSMDGDGQHLASEIPKLLALARAEPSAIVIGNRIIGDQTVAGANRLGNRVANLAVSLAAGRPLGDTQSGFRVYPLASVLSLAAAGNRFEYETTILIHAVRASMAVVSVAVDVHYPPVAERVSHYRKVVDTLRIIRAVAPLLLRR